MLLHVKKYISFQLSTNRQFSINRTNNKIIYCIPLKITGTLYIPYIYIARFKLLDIIFF